MRCHSWVGQWAMWFSRMRSARPNSPMSERYSAQKRLTVWPTQLVCLPSRLSGKYWLLATE